MEKICEVANVPAKLNENLRDNTTIGLGKHILSEYALRPVACDSDPWRMTHVNKFNENFQ